MFTDPPSEAPVEQLGPSLTRQLLNAGKPGQTVVYTFTNSDITPQIVDIWMINLRGTVDDWPPEQPYLALYDMSQLQDSVRAYEYAFNQMRAFRQSYPDLVVRIAGVFPNSLLGQLSAQALQLFAYAVGREHVRVEIFFNRADGLHWLEQFTAR